MRDMIRDERAGGTTATLWALLAILALGAALAAAPASGAAASDTNPTSTDAAPADPTAGPDIEVTPLDETDDGSDVGLASAQRCSGDVCIRVEGSGLTVDKWETWFDADAATCTRAYFWQDDTVIATSDWTCSDGPARFTSTWNSPGTFPDGTQLCNTWANATGKPCVEIRQ